MAALSEQELRHYASQIKLPVIINGLTSGYQTVEVLKILLDIGDVLTGKLLKINILNNTFKLEAISRNNNINQNRMFSDRKS